LIFYLTNKHFIKGLTNEKTENSRLPEGTFLKTGVITQVMDIQEPISKLRTLLENHLGIDLSAFQIWLQDKLKVSRGNSIRYKLELI